VFDSGDLSFDVGEGWHREVRVRAVQSAIALAVFCRADLTEAKVDNAGFPEFSRNVYRPGLGLQGLEGAGRDLMAKYGISPLWFRGTRPSQFRLKMRWLMAQVWLCAYGGHTGKRGHPWQ